MKTVIDLLDEFMSFVYASTLSIMDVVAINIIAIFASEFHWAIWILLAPWIWYSTHQKLKYEK